MQYYNFILPLVLTLVWSTRAEDATYPPASEELTAAYNAFYGCINWDQDVFSKAFMGCTTCTGAQTAAAGLKLLGSSTSINYTCPEFNNYFCTAYDACSEDCLAQDPCGRELKDFMLVTHYEGYGYQQCAPYSCPGDDAADSDATTATGGVANGGAADKVNNTTTGADPKATKTADSSGSSKLFLGTAATTGITLGLFVVGMMIW